MLQLRSVLTHLVTPRRGERDWFGALTDYPGPRRWPKNSVKRHTLINDR